MGWFHDVTEPDPLSWPMKSDSLVIKIHLYLVLLSCSVCLLIDLQEYDSAIFLNCMPNMGKLPMFLWKILWLDYCGIFSICTTLSSQNDTARSETKLFPNSLSVQKSQLLSHPGFPKEEIWRITCPLYKKNTITFYASFQLTVERWTRLQIGLESSEMIPGLGWMASCEKVPDNLRCCHTKHSKN